MTSMYFKMPAMSDDKALMEQCFEILWNAFAVERGWIKVHAAEALLDLGDHATVYPKILDDCQSWEESSRIGLWRVLASSAAAPEGAAALAKIEEVFIASQYPLQLNALESLCKLKFVASGRALEKLRAMALLDSEPEAPFAYWALQLSGDVGMEEKVAVLLLSADPRMRKLAAFVLRWMRCKEEGVLRKLARAAALEARESEAYPFLLGAALALEADAIHAGGWKDGVRRVLTNGTNEGRYEVCQALQHCFGKEDLSMLIPLLKSQDPDVRIASALAITTAAKA